MAITVVLWILAVVVAIVLLDLARRSVRPFLMVVAGGVARIICSLRRESLRLHAAVTRWHRDHLLRLETEQVYGEGRALECRYANLIGLDLAQLPALRHEARVTLQALQEAYVRDERRLAEDPAWVQRLEALASSPVGDSPQSQRLVQDIQETVLRIARLGLEEHRQVTRGLLATRRRMEAPVNHLVDRLERLHRRLDRLERQGARFDQALLRMQDREHSFGTFFPAYLQSGSRWILGLLGLGLTAVAVVVYYQLFGTVMGGPLAQETGMTETWLSEWVLVVLLGVAAVCGWILAESRGISRLLPEALLEQNDWAHAALVALAVLVLTAIAVLSALSGFYLEWVQHRHELLDTLTAGTDTVPVVRLVDQLVGATLGLVVPLVVALAPVWLVGVLRGTRVLLGGGMVVILAVVAGVLYLLAVVVYQFRRLLPVSFDLVTFPARMVREKVFGPGTDA